MCGLIGSVLFHSRFYNLIKTKYDEEINVAILQAGEGLWLIM